MKILPILISLIFIVPMLSFADSCPAPDQITISYSKDTKKLTIEPTTINEFTLRPVSDVPANPSTKIIRYKGSLFSMEKKPAEDKDGIYTVKSVNSATCEYYVGKDKEEYTFRFRKRYEPNFVTDLKQGSGQNEWQLLYDGYWYICYADCHWAPK